LGVFLAAIALARDFYEHGIDDGSGFRKDALRINMGIKSLKEREGGTSLDEGFAEAPEAGEVGDGFANVEAEEAGEGEPVGDLVFDLGIAEVVKALEDEGFGQGVGLEAPCAPRWSRPWPKFSPASPSKWKAASAATGAKNELIHLLRQTSRPQRRLPMIGSTENPKRCKVDVKQE
jgi:hypothetical protein